MKKHGIKIWLFTIALAPFLCGCPKSHVTPAPEQDKEFQSSIDASFATFVVTDIDMMCSFVGEGNYYPDFYGPSPVSTGTFFAYRDLAYEMINIDFDNNKTACKDGKLRKGTIFMGYGNPNANTDYYHQYQFHGQVTLSDYQTDGWLVSTVGGNPVQIHNLLPGANYNPSQTKLSWLIEGSFEFKHPSDPTRNITWSGKIIKTLENMSISSNQRINWASAIVSYKGEISGMTAANVPFTMKIEDQNPLVRDFSCFPDKVGGIVTTEPLKSWNSEFHPFSKGVVHFSTGDLYPRVIYYGNEANKALEAQCDNSGEILIQGNLYRVDFMK